MVKNKYALISVFDKRGIVPLAQTLIRLGYRLISTGGTAKILRENHIPVIPIQEITGSPEAFDGRMKTISFQIQSGILFDRTNQKHVIAAKKLGIKPIDIVISNLYPFESSQSVENIDVGGPTMVRAGAKNFNNVLVVIDPDDYEKISHLLIANKVTQKIRQALSAKAFAHLTVYDSLIARYLNKELFPGQLTIPLRKIASLRYGENPHQQAAFYMEPNTASPLQNLKKIAGRDLSLINVTDINAGIESIRFFDIPCAVVIKHNNPCGLALGKTIAVALDRAIMADPESAFGGIIVTNQKVDLKTAKVVADFKSERRSNIDIFAAPGFDQKAIGLLTKTRKTMGLYAFSKIKKPRKTEKNIKFVLGGAIIQTVDYADENTNEWIVVTKKKPTKQQITQMKIAWKFIARIKSNSIIIVDKVLPMTRGIGSGQTSRIRSTRIALEQAKEYTKGAILASDSFFPFPDSVKLAAKYGIAAVIQQGGSINDKLSIDEADRAGIVMVFTKKRAFWH